MKPRKLDRFERVVLKAIRKNDRDYEVCSWLTGPDVVTLLRKEHAWVRRMVKKVWNWQAEQLADNADVCSVILEQLQQHRK